MTRRDRSGDDRPNGGETRGAAGTTDRRFRAIARNDLDLISEVDAQGHVYYASSNHATLIPGAFDATGSESLLEMVAPEQQDEVVREFARVFSDHEGVRVPFRVRADGEPRWFEITASPFVAEDGTTHAILVSRDVSAAKQADERLRSATPAPAWTSGPDAASSSPSSRRSPRVTVSASRPCSDWCAATGAPSRWRPAGSAARAWACTFRPAARPSSGRRRLPLDDAPPELRDD